MESNILCRGFSFSLLFVVLGSATISNATSEGIISVLSVGSVVYWPRVDVSVNVSRAVGSNYLSLGTEIDYEWKQWIDSPVQRELVSSASFKLVRFFDFKNTSPLLKPCTYWNESARTGTWNWINVDIFVQRVFTVGAEPLICLGWATDHTQSFIPAGMIINATTGLPNPMSWAAYCKEFVKHFKATSMPVRFYETMNEPWAYFGWNDYTKLANFMAVFNAAAQAMRTEDPNVLVSFDGTNRKPVLNYWLANGGADLDFISFHKYDCGTIGYYSDATMLARAETFQIETSSDYYGVQDSRQVYHNARGKWIPAINSESNYDSVCDVGSDPKIQDIVGAVWTALLLRKGVLVGLNYSVYFTFSSSASWEKANKATGGLGFGMVNSDDNKPWYPYYVQKILGSNLSVGDVLFETTCSSSDMRALAWLHDGHLKLLLICRTDRTYAVHLNGITGNFDVMRIDNTIPWNDPARAVQTGAIDATQTFVVQGYTIALLSS